MVPAICRTSVEQASLAAMYRDWRVLDHAVDVICSPPSTHFTGDVHRHVQHQHPGNPFTCPNIGCSQTVSMSDLKDAMDITRKIARAAKKKRLEAMEAGPAGVYSSRAWSRILLGYGSFLRSSACASASVA